MGRSAATSFVLICLVPSASGSLSFIAGVPTRMSNTDAKKSDTLVSLMLLEGSQLDLPT